MSKIYIQILGKYQYVTLFGAPVENNPYVIITDGDELSGIGISTKFDLSTMKIVPMTEKEVRKKDIKSRLKQITEKLNAQDYIHCRQMRETTLLSLNKISKLSLSNEEYQKFCEAQQLMLDEYHLLEAEFKELTLFED